MKKDEFQNFLNISNIGNYSRGVIDNMIGVLMLDPIAEKNLIIRIGKMPILIKESLYWNKFYSFICGIRKVEEDLESSVKLSNILFDTPKKRKENGMRLLTLIDRADSEQKIDYYVNATRSLLMNCIDIVLYFRIMKAVSETLNEDLEYLKKVAIHKNEIKGNIQLLALERSGLVRQASLNEEEDIESQGYVISFLGRMVDCYAISFGDEERMNFYKNNQINNHYFDLGIGEITNEEIEEMFKIVGFDSINNK